MEAFCFFFYTSMICYYGRGCSYAEHISHMKKQFSEQKCLIWSSSSKGLRFCTLQRDIIFLSPNTYMILLLVSGISCHTYGSSLAASSHWWSTSWGSLSILAYCGQPCLSHCYPAWYCSCSPQSDSHSFWKFTSHAAILMETSTQSLFYARDSPPQLYAYSDSTLVLWMPRCSIEEELEHLLLLLLLLLLLMASMVVGRFWYFLWCRHTSSLWSVN